MNEATQNDLARAVQKGVPLEQRAFRELGAQLDLSEEQVIGQLQEWKDNGFLREISAVMEGSAIGHESALVCGRIPEADMGRVAAIVSGHPMVTHNYEREHSYNLWFTIAAPLDVGIERHIRALETATGAGPFHALRRTITFKVGVVFDMKTLRNDTDVLPLAAPADTPPLPTPEEQSLIRALQSDLPVCTTPFVALAEQHNVDVDRLLDYARTKMGGQVRKYIGTFRHRRMGVSANGMTVWNVPTERLAEVGALLAAEREVSHCYGRETVPDFPYSLYSMLHAPSREELDRIAGRVAERIGISDYLVLNSTREFKKTRLRYFLPELDAWWQAHGQAA